MNAIGCFDNNLFLRISLYFRINLNIYFIGIILRILKEFFIKAIKMILVNEMDLFNWDAKVIAQIYWR